MFEKLEVDVVALILAGVAAVRAFWREEAITRKDVDLLLKEFQDLRAELSKLNKALQDQIVWRAGTEEFREITEEKLRDLEKAHLDLRTAIIDLTMKMVELRAQHSQFHSLPPSSMLP